MTRIFIKYPKACFCLALLLQFFSCNPSCKVDGVEVGELLLVKSRENAYPYCKLLKASIQGDDDAIRELSLLDFSDSAGYDHGAVLVDLIGVIGEEKFISAIATVSENEKNKLEAYIEVGLMYGGNPDFEGKTVKEAFPRIYTVLRDKPTEQPW